MTQQAAEQFERLITIMAQLRAPGGCPWDQEQTLESIKPYLIEEAYEVIEAIDAQDVAAHREELGDLLLQVVFQAEIAREKGWFDIAQVVEGIADKMVRRHPHVFGEQASAGVAQTLRRWEAIKRQEKAGRSAIAGVPKQMPGLARAQRITEKASRVGFDWDNVAQVLEKVDEERAELQEAIAGGDRAAISDELGDVLFALANLARFLDVNAEEALRSTIDRFIYRFHYIEKSLEEQGRSVEVATLEEMEELWQEAKVKAREGS